MKMTMTMSMSKMSTKQIQFIHLVTSLAFVTFLILSQTHNQVPDFVRGIVAGVSFGGSVFVLLNFKLLKAAMSKKS
ncbi:hypothetical protein [Cohnella sp. WQ 127256]|uniref:hypothetical protein n=1 Tax=Cohnella sp. WQ 127256 TaxID=2938790 RepID=UPI002117C4A0|nr:hypothetical protein [Cohnella sp. WQ 127256]